MGPPGCTQPGGDFNFTGVAIESFRAIAISAYMVGETVVALGTELGRMPQHCGYDNSVDTSQKRNKDFAEGDLFAGSKDVGSQDDASLVSYPPSATKRRKRPFAFFGLSNRAKKNFGQGMPPASSTTQSKAASSNMSSSKAAPSTPPRRPASTKKVTISPSTVKVTPPRTPPSSKRTKIKSSPLRANRLLQCFSKKPAEEDMKFYGRYRTENEDMHLSGDSTVYTIRMSRVPTGSRYAEI
jgi:hypothetical protein